MRVGSSGQLVEPRHAVEAAEYIRIMTGQRRQGGIMHV